jgi:hypothetical protein
MTSSAQTSTSVVREAVGVRRRVAATEAHLVRALARERDEDVGVDGQGPIFVGVELDEPAVDALRVELDVPGRVEQAHRRGLAWPPRIGHVEPLELAGAPAGDVQVAIVDRQRDVGDERRHGAERLQDRRQLVGLGRLGGDRDDLLDAHPAVVAPAPQPHRRRQVGRRGDDADKPVGLRRVVRRAQLEHHLVFRAEVDLLHVPAALEIPDVQPVAVLVTEQQLAHEPVLDHLRRAPLARDDGVVVEVPPEVVRELLRPAVVLPLALDREVVVVEQEDAAGTAALRVAERRDVDAVGTAVDGVGAAVARLARDLLGLDHLHELRGARVVLDVEDVDAGGAQPGHEQVAPLDVRVRRPRAQRRRARVPAEVVQLVAGVGHVEPADEIPVGLRARLEVEDGEGVRPAVPVGPVFSVAT